MQTSIVACEMPVPVHVPAICATLSRDLFLTSRLCREASNSPTLRDRTATWPSMLSLSFFRLSRKRFCAALFLAFVLSFVVSFGLQASSSANITESLSDQHILRGRQRNTSQHGTRQWARHSHVAQIQDVLGVGIRQGGLLQIMSLILHTYFML